MNVQLKDITVTARDGRVSHLDQVYIRGSHVRFFIVPDMLRYVAHFDQSVDLHWSSPTLEAIGLIMYIIGMPPCFVREASVGAVLVWRVVRLPCSGRVASGEAECEQEERVCRIGQNSVVGVRLFIVLVYLLAKISILDSSVLLLGSSTSSVVFIRG